MNTLLGRMLDWTYYAGECVLIRFVGRDGPRGLMRAAFRIPVWLYRHRLGGLVRRNVLVLTTRGRRTGRLHLNAMRYERDVASDTYYVLSGWAGRTDWYRNVRHHPQVEVVVGDRHFRTTATLLTVEDGMDVLRSYLRRNPFAVRTIRCETGISYDGSERCLRAIATHYPAVALAPEASAAPG